jgi:two-component system response regulator GlrR
MRWRLNVADLDLMLKEMESRLGMEPAASDSERPEILVVDDDAALRSSLCDVLNVRYFVVACETGDLALKRCSPSTRVVLSDIKMPGKNGFTVFREIKEHRPDVPIVFFTAYPGDHEDLQESRLLEAFATLHKGVSVTLLIDVIERA